MYLAYIRVCYAVATSLVMGWIGWGGILTFMYLAYMRGCYAVATSLVGWYIYVGQRCIHYRYAGVSSSWSTRKDGVVNPQLLQGIRVWQWRWHHGNSTDFLRLTGKALSKPLEKWHATEEQEKRFQAATTTKPCKYHDIHRHSFKVIQFWPAKFKAMFFIKCVRRHSARRVSFQKVLNR